MGPHLELTESLSKTTADARQASHTLCTSKSTVLPPLLKVLPQPAITLNTKSLVSTGVVVEALEPEMLTFKATRLPSLIKIPQRTKRFEVNSFILETGLFKSLVLQSAWKYLLSKKFFMLSNVLFYSQ